MYKRKNKISEKSKERIYRSISMKRKKRMSISLESRTINDDPSQKKKKEMYRRNLLNYLRLTFILSPLSFHPLEISPVFLLFHRSDQKFHPLSRDHESTKSFSLYIYIYLSLNSIIRSILLSSFRLKFRRLFLLLLRQRNRRMIVKTLGHQLKGERILLPARLLDLRPLVLKPDLDLRLVQAQIPRELLPPPLRQVSILRELPLQPGQLLPAKCRPRTFLLRGAAIATAIRPLHPSRPRTCNTVRSYCQLISVEISGELRYCRGSEDY